MLVMKASKHTSAYFVMYWERYYYKDDNTWTKIMKIPHDQRLRKLPRPVIYEDDHIDYMWKKKEPEYIKDLLFRIYLYQKYNNS